MRRLVVEADGGSRGNPGVAGYGALVREGRSVLRELAAPLGKESNNVAEYTGLIVGLGAALEIAAGEPVAIDVRMDSKLVVEQMSGRWKIKHADMQRLAREARALVADVVANGGSVDFTWIPRAENKAADALSNEGMDGRHVDRTPGGSAPGGSGDEDDPGEAAPPPAGWREVLTRRSGVQEGAATTAGTAEPTGASEATVHSVSGGAEDETTAMTGTPAPTGAAATPAATPAPDLSPPVRIALVRHGVTEYTRQGRLDGRGGSDPALTAEGTAQARAAARGVEAFLGRGGVVRVVTSSLQRARQTGAAVAATLGVPAEVEADLDELCFGSWEGRTVAELTREEVDSLQRSRTAEDVPPPGGESYTDLADRVLPAMRRLVDELRDEAARTEAGGAPAVSPTLVLVTHRGPIGVILADVLGLPRPHVWRLATAPCSLTSIRTWRDGGVVVEFVNDTSHLR
ncbi:bifunctional RNase H/acid phosphatase [Mobilicoccus pelagius]|nr:bifunctional RNase H/acid phosphatase [Mobilicoccus pelagius]